MGEAMRTCLLMLAITAVRLTSAQTWCPPGAQWWYDYEDMTVGREGVIRLTHIGDTMIGGLAAQHLALEASGVFIFTQQPFSGQGSPVITRIDGGAVSHWDGNQWRLVFDLSQPPGGGWVLSGDNILDHEVLVADTGRIEQNGTELRYLAVEITRPNGMTIVDTVFERLGFARIYLEPWRSLMLEADVTGLRCYGDQDISYTRANVMECDFVLSMGEELGVQKPAVFYDGSGDVLVLRSGVYNTGLMVCDALGRVVLQAPQVTNGAAIDVSELRSGSYILVAYTQDSGHVGTRWVKP
jgi:hypothetical protein